MLRIWHRYYGGCSSSASLWHIDGELRRDLPRPAKDSTVASLLEEFRHQKDIWFDIYGSSATSKNRQEPSRYGKQPQGQYGIYGNGFSFGGAYRPYGSSYPYGSRPFVPYDGSYQNNNSTNPQQAQPQQ